MRASISSSRAVEARPGAHQSWWRVLLPWFLTALACAGLVLAADALHRASSARPTPAVPTVAATAGIAVLLGGWHIVEGRAPYLWRRIAGVCLVLVGLQASLQLLALEPRPRATLAATSSGLLLVLVAFLLLRRSRVNLATPLFGTVAAEAVIIACLALLSLGRWIEVRGVTLGWDSLLHLVPLGVYVLVAAVLLVILLTDRQPLIAVANLGVILLCALGCLRLLRFLTGQPLPGWSYALSVFGVVVVAGAMFHLEAPRALSSPEVIERFEVHRRVVVWVIFGLALLVSVQLHLMEPGVGMWHLTVADMLSVSVLALLLLTLTLRDATQMRRASSVLRQLRSQARVDPLTGIGNRRALNDAITELPRRQVAVLMVDLDKFKEVNDLVGHAAGDALLVQVADQLCRVGARAGARVYRLGGDEFCVLAPVGITRATALAREFVTAIQTRTGHLTSGGHLRIGASVGIHHISSAEPALVTDGITAAGQAMREAKRAARAVERRTPDASVRVFDVAMRERLQRRVTIESRLQREFEAVDLVYQPIVDTRTGQVAGFEALARWWDPVLGRVAPGEFIHIAEHSGQICELGRHLLARAVGEFAVEGGFAAGAFLSLNVSPLELLADDYTATLLAELERWRVDPEQILLEVTESALLVPNAQLSEVMHRLAGRGLGLCIDDFGAGDTSVRYLPSLPITTLKLNRRLTADVDARGGVLLRGIVDMARGLGLTVIMEGVETAEQHELAVTSGAPYTQGWLHSRGRSAHSLFEPVGPHRNQALGNEDLGLGETLGVSEDLGLSEGLGRARS